MGNIFNTIITIPLYNILIFLFAIVRDMGISILLLTLVVRLALIKQSVKAEKSRLALQKVQPELKKIQEEYKNDKDKQAKAMMEFYKEKGINPFSSCGATLFQLPFLIGLFIVFREGIKSGFPLYGPVKNILGTTVITSTSFGILDLTVMPNKGWMLILPVIATALQFVQAKMMLGKTKEKSGKGTGQSTMNMTMYLLPGITLLFTMTLPSALSIYWIATTLFAIAQQVFIDKYEIKHHPELKP